MGEREHLFFWKSHSVRTALLCKKSIPSIQYTFIEKILRFKLYTRDEHQFSTRSCLVGLFGPDPHRQGFNGKIRFPLIAYNSYLRDIARFG